MALSPAYCAFARLSLLKTAQKDENCGGRIVAATRAPGAAPAWRERELTAEAVGAWEPAFDPIAWEERREVHMLVENVVQRDGDDRHAAPVGPAEIGDLVWKPDTATGGVEK